MSFESENTTPSIILCVFPHLEKILLLNSIDSTKNIITLNSKIMFNDERNIPRNIPRLMKNTLI